ncbi:hypothetical protein HHI36_004409 [Cryptolaemus montrouzieri]|uniref:Uncharacterized protein n=1 Tax=Cryptolaemus montrouzieri TaxID=559131 RepID=A0ABD2NR30_9CUCU
MRDGPTSSAEDIEYSKAINKKHQKWTKFNVYLLHQNVQSLQYKIGRVEEFLETLKEEPQIIGLTEHWFRAGEDDLAAVGGYHLVSAYSRGVKRNGGSCLYARNEADLEFEEVLDLKQKSQETHIE